ncbi:nucleoid-associated protein [Winogradskyella sediminis]|uniref:Nucleoid-associated protein YejK n=1 Tax=Winogradskyella sediminis TaxID=1382466 RepID=A0A1H1MU08_9FLAO|nr:nucleoid-associated protein [Winogradskyella sediminis]SDR90363.1 Nucleoid-associated protein YejK [Winogradskyella sediminis]
MEAEIRIKRLTIHQIEKQQSVLEAHLKTSKGLIPIDEKVDFLVEKLNDAFRNDEKVVRTEFLEEEEEEEVFQKSLKSFVESETDELFYKFSINALKKMKKILQSTTLATGGYFVFVNYQYGDGSYVGVFIVRDSKEVIFNRNDEDNFEVNMTTIINTDKLAMAVRIDSGRLEENKDRYLQFTHKLSSTSNYFSEWIEADLLDKSEDDTKALISLINGLTEFPINPETGERYGGEEFRIKVYDHINSAGRVVRLSELGKTFWNDSNYLTNYIDENEIQINHQFQAVSTILGRLKKYEIKSGKVKLSFSRADIENGTINVGNDDQIIISDSALRRKYDELNGQ